VRPPEQGVAGPSRGLRLPVDCGHRTPRRARASRSRSKDPPLISQADIGAVVGLEGSIRPNSGAVDQVPRSSPAHRGSRDVPLGPPARRVVGPSHALPVRGSRLIPGGNDSGRRFFSITTKISSGCSDLSMHTRSPSGTTSTSPVRRWQVTPSQVEIVSKRRRGGAFPSPLSPIPQSSRGDIGKRVTRTLILWHLVGSEVLPT
jgi:hypothetical protein